MIKYYEIDNRKFKLEKTSSGYYDLTLIEGNDPEPMKWRFTTLEKALIEIVSYSEIDEDDYNE